MRFWLDRKVDGFRLDTVNFYFHSEGLEANPALASERLNASIAPEVNPYNLQDHIYDKSQPKNLEFLKKIRNLMDEYPNVTSVGEIGDAQHQQRIMAEYTSGDERLHMAYAFDFLGGSFDVKNFREAIIAASETKDSWQCLAFSNHDVVRHVSRWAKHGQEEDFARLAAMLLLSMRGSVCLYQGEELGLTEADIAFDELMDPYGVEFWPNFKGRDGCRTPMVWQAQANFGGFTTASKSWLPVPADHLRRAVDQQERSNAGSVLEFYRQFIQFRKSREALISGGIELLDAGQNILAFIRYGGDEKLLCAFNMSNAVVNFHVPEGTALKDLAAPGSVNIDNAKENELPAFGALIAQIVS
jgi:alpha-glucosidase